MLHWLISLAPVAVLFCAIAFLRIRVPLAAAIAIACAVISSAILETLTLDNLQVSLVDGSQAALSILYAVWPAIFLYEFMNSAKSFSRLKDAATRLSRDRLILVLIFGWICASFLQSITGFGVPVAVCAPFLVALGIKPVPAVIMTLLGHAWANTYGTLGLAWDALLRFSGLTGIEQITSTSQYAGVFLWIVNLSGALGICLIYGRIPALIHGTPFVLINSTIMAGGQYWLAQINPVIAAFLPSAAAVLITLTMLRMGIYIRPWGCSSSVITPASGGITATSSGIKTEGSPNPASIQVSSKKEIGIATLPFLLLAATSLILFLTPSLSDILATVTIAGVPVLYHPGAVLTVTVIFTLLIFRRYGYIDTVQMRQATRAGLDKLVGTSLGIVALLVLARVLFSTGQIGILAHGVAAKSGNGYVPFSAALGTFGAFVTSSNMSSNILLAAFQNSVATRIAIPAPLLLAAQTAGGAAGAVIGPATILLGATTAGVKGEEGRILRPLLAISLGQAMIVGFLVWTLASMN